MSEILLFRIAEMNWDIIDIQSDILISQVWSVYRDGTIKSYAEYSVSGITEIEKTKMTSLEFYIFRWLLKIFEKSKDDFSACDGTGYEMILFDKKNRILHEFKGYIYNSIFLKKVKELVSDKTNLVFPEFGNISTWFSRVLLQNDHAIFGQIAWSF